MTDEPRTCACGCGSNVLGRQRFLNDAHRKRAARARFRLAANPDANPDKSDANPDAPASLEAAVDQVLEEFPNVPAALGASLRMLATQLDRRPDHSPLWGRFLTAVSEALEHAGSAVDERGVAALYSVREGCYVPEEHAPAPGGVAVTHCAWCCREGRYA
ncbi:MAG TPA: hypothetical protein VNP94_10700 [Actinomycetota bacterium]|nr:hypothetical protein [Actinomycetota bacterium]